MPTAEYLNYETLDNRGWDIDDDILEKAEDADFGDDVEIIYNDKHLDYLQSRVIYCRGHRPIGKRTFPKYPA